jgi:hypothetical protein
MIDSSGSVLFLSALTATISTTAEMYSFADAAYQQTKYECILA